MIYGVKIRIAVAILAFMMSNWPVILLFGDNLLGYLYVAWLTVVVAAFILSLFPDTGKMERRKL